MTVSCFNEKLDENFNEFECCSCRQKVQELVLMIKFISNIKSLTISRLQYVYFL